MSDDKRPPEHPTPRPGNEDAFSSDGVDLTLIRWMRSLTPAERLAVLQRHVSSVTRLREDRAVLPILRRTIEELERSEED